MIYLISRINVFIVSGIALLMVFLIRYLATFIVWIIVGLAIIACIGK